jgi:hypothetical protein
MLVGKGGLKMKESPPDSDPDKDPKGTTKVAANGVGVNYGHGTSSLSRITVSKPVN